MPEIVRAKGEADDEEAEEAEKGEEDETVEDEMVEEVVGRVEDAVTSMLPVGAKGGE